jgi:hypothetical protein
LIVDLDDSEKKGPDPLLYRVLLGCFEVGAITKYFGIYIFGTLLLGVPRMLRIGRRAVLANRMARAIGAVEAVVAGLAEATERAEPEGSVVPMPHDVISDHRRHDMAALKAKPA